MPAQPVPIEVLAARGINGKTLGGRDIVATNVNALERKPPPPMPEGLGDRGEVEWHKIWQAGRWLWPDQDYAWVEQVSRAYDDLDQFRKKITAEGLMIPGQRNTMVVNPLIAEVRHAEDTIRRCLSILGFSPTDRARLKLTEIQGESAYQKLQREMNSGAGQANSQPKTTASYVEDSW